MCQSGDLIPLWPGGHFVAFQLGMGRWLAGVMGRRNHNVAAVAQANKTARIVWALLAHDRQYDAKYVVAA